MIVHDHEQGSPEWRNCRAGVITGSMVGTIRSKVGLLDEKQASYVQARQSGMSEKQAMEVAGYKAPPKSSTVARALQNLPIGDWSDTSKKYAFRLACERIAGVPLDEQFETYAMRRGKELEEGCRIEHESQIEQLVMLAGFVTTDDGHFGASADALVGDDGGAEYKCFYDPSKLAPMILDDNWDETTDQSAMGIWVTGRHWWDMCLYVPALRMGGLHFSRKRLERDDNWLELMEADLVEFDNYVCDIETRLRNIGANRKTLLEGKKQ